METKKYLFICSSQYAIFNAINAVLNNIEECKDNADIVIFHRTDDIRNISERIKESKIFGNVYDYSFIGNMNAFSLLSLFVFPKFLLNKLCLNDISNYIKKNQYDVLVSQNQLYASLFRRINKNADVYLIEDGLSSYTGRTINSKRRSIYFRLADKILFNGSLFTEVKKQLLYNPEMYVGNNSIIKKLPVRKFSNNIIYDRIFDYKYNTLYNTHKFVYLGAPLYGLKDLMLDPNDAGDDFDVKAIFLEKSRILIRS